MATVIDTDVDLAEKLAAERQVASPLQRAAEPHLEQFRYDDQIFRMFAAATVLWGLIGMAVGLLVAVLMVMQWLASAHFWIGTIGILLYILHRARFNRVDRGAERGGDLSDVGFIHSIAGSVVAGGVGDGCVRLLHPRPSVRRP